MDAPRGLEAARPTRRRQALPRVLAVLCYSLPIVPAVVVLLRARRHRFLRFHAAQALIFSCLLALGQTAIYLLMLFAGELIRDLGQATIAALVFFALYAALGLLAFVGWFRLAGDCIDGRARKLPIVGDWAARLERLTRRD